MLAGTAASFTRRHTGTALPALAASSGQFELGVQMFERATRLDPDFALAQARLGSMNARMYHYGFDRSESRLERARTAAERSPVD